MLELKLVNRIYECWSKGLLTGSQHRSTNFKNPYLLNNAYSCFIFEETKNLVIYFLNQSSLHLKLVSRKYDCLSVRVSIFLEFLKTGFVKIYFMKFLSNSFEILCTHVFFCYYFYLKNQSNLNSNALWSIFYDKWSVVMNV